MITVVQPTLFSGMSRGSPWRTLQQGFLCSGFGEKLAVVLRQDGEEAPLASSLPGRSSAVMVVHKWHHDGPHTAPPVDPP